MPGRSQALDCSPGAVSPKLGRCPDRQILLAFTTEFAILLRREGSWLEKTTINRSL